MNIKCAHGLRRELDHAMLRRLEKRILVDLPTFEARRAMFMHHLPPVVCSKDGGLELLADLDYDMLGVVSSLCVCVCVCAHVHACVCVCVCLCVFVCVSVHASMIVVVRFVNI
jgi:hypothetical protein